MTSGMVKAVLPPCPAGLQAASPSTAGLAARGLAPLLLWWLAIPAASAATPERPLRPPDRSSPRAALETFLESGDALAAFMARDYLPSPSREKFHRLISLADPAVQSLDLSEVPPAARMKTGRAATAALYDTLNRIPLPPPEEIPDSLPAGPDGSGEPARWTIPDTEIVLERVRGGPRSGEFLFSAGTVARAKEFNDRVRGLPLIRPLPLEELPEIVVQGGGWMVPFPWIRAMPGWLRNLVAGQAGWKWIALALVLGVAALLLRAVHRLSLRAGAERPFRRALARSALPAFVLAATPVVAYLALVQINLIGGTAAAVELGSTAVMFLAGAWISWRAAPVVAEAVIASPGISRESVDAHLIRISTRLLGMAGAGALLATGAGRVGIPVYGVVAGLGIGGLAIALAAQPTIENLIGGLSLFADKPIRVGDFCRYGENTGTVEAIGIRSTRIRGEDRSVTTIPNATLSKMPIVNFSQRDRVLIRVEFGVSAGTRPEPLRKALAAIRQALQGDPRVHPDSARARLVGIGAGTLQVEVFAYARSRDPGEAQAIQEDLLLEIVDLVRRGGVSFLLPPQALSPAADPGSGDATPEAGPAKREEEGSPGS